jgi:hypothetical protein
MRRFLALLTVICLTAVASGAGPCSAKANECCDRGREAAAGRVTGCCGDCRGESEKTPPRPDCPKCLGCVSPTPAVPIDHSVMLAPMAIVEATVVSASLAPSDPSASEILHVPRMDRFRG